MEYERRRIEAAHQQPSQQNGQEAASGHVRACEPGLLRWWSNPAVATGFSATERENRRKRSPEKENGSEREIRHLRHSGAEAPNRI